MQDIADTIRIVTHVDVIDVHPAAAHGVEGDDVFEVFATETARRPDMVLTVSGGQLIAEADDDVAQAIEVSPALSQVGRVPIGVGLEPAED